MLRYKLAFLLSGAAAATHAGMVCAREVEVHAFAGGAAAHFELLVPDARPPRVVAEPGVPGDEGMTVPPGQMAFVRPSACSVPATPVGTRLSRLAQIRRVALLPAVTAVACAEGVPAGLLDALIIHESRYDTTAKSNRGAVGLTQLMPGTSRGLGVRNPWSAVQNLQGGARYLRRQLDAFGRYDLALAAYNAGPGQVLRHNGVPPFAETRAYVDDVLGALLSAGQGAASSVAMHVRGTGQGRRVLLNRFAGYAPPP